MYTIIYQYHYEHKRSMYKKYKTGDYDSDIYVINILKAIAFVIIE